MRRVLRLVEQRRPLEAMDRLAPKAANDHLTFSPTARKVNQGRGTVIEFYHSRQTLLIQWPGTILLGLSETRNRLRKRSREATSRPGQRLVTVVGQAMEDGKAVNLQDRIISLLDSRPLLNSTPCQTIDSMPPRRPQAIMIQIVLPQTTHTNSIKLRLKGILLDRALLTRSKVVVQLLTSAESNLRQFETSTLHLKSPNEATRCLQK